MQRILIEEVKKKISKYETITILSHLNPDADTLGTALGIYALLLQEKNKRVEVVNVSEVLPRYLDFLPYFHKIKDHMDYEESLIISCDCGSIDRLGIDVKGRDIINIDHHFSNTMYGTTNIVISEYASASQVAYKLFKALYEIKGDSATCFYAALFSDTRYFTTNNMNKEVFSVAYALTSAGAEIHKVAQHFTQRRALSSLRILERALKSLTLYFDAKVVSLVVTKDDIAATGASIPDMEGIVDYGKSLVTVDIAFFIMEFQDEIRISLRSKEADIFLIANAFGGGGHKHASGMTLKGYTIEESIDILLKKIDELGLTHEK